MKKLIFALLCCWVAVPTMAQNESHNVDRMDRIEFCKKTYTALFGGEALTGQGTDPEFMDILQKFIFGEVFATGNLDHPTRELITCTTLAVMQTLPQLKAHAGAALNVGVSPVELREAMYQCAPFIGFPKTLNAIGTVNEVFQERGIALPLEHQGTVTEESRAERGAAIQQPLYGDEIARKLADVPGGMGKEVARFLTEYCFGDLYTRNGLELKTRELLIYCILTALNAEDQLYAHAAGNLRIGNSEETLAAAVVQCLPYVGFPAAMKALEAIEAAKESVAE